MVPGFLYRRLVRRGVTADLSGELIERLGRMDSVLGDLITGDGAPPGFLPELAPGVPRIRPLLVLLSAEAVQRGAAADSRRAEELAVAAELLHLAIAVHDTALGRQGGRRRRAARRLVGGAVGWLGGNHLTLRALELTRSAGPETLSDLLDALREASDGHALTQTLQGRLATTPEATSHAEHHTGAGFSFACRAGARLAGADRGIVGSLGRYGRHAGVAWHLAEELSLLEHDTEDRTAQLTERAAFGHPILAVCLAAEHDPEIARLWGQLCRSEEPEVAERLLQQVHRSGAIAEGHQRLLKRTWRARRALNTLPPSPHRDALERLAMALVH